jgi:broad specificity phosphatase PhoE
MSARIVLVKHAQPVLDAAVPPRDWQLGAEGEEQAARLARRLEEFAPFALASSREPKALKTAEIVGRAFSLPVDAIDGLEEFDRPALPLMSPAERERINAQIFESPLQRVLGNESAAEALARFSQGVTTALGRAADSRTVVLITHGTVMSLFVAAHNDVDARELWKRLQCASFVVLALPGFRLTHAMGTPVL